MPVVFILHMDMIYDHISGGIRMRRLKSLSCPTTVFICPLASYFPLPTAEAFLLSASSVLHIIE
jgi:hypothetical protein